LCVLLNLEKISNNNESCVYKEMLARHGVFKVTEREPISIYLNMSKNKPTKTRPSQFDLQSSDFTLDVISHTF